MWLLVLLSSGCITRGHHELTEVQLEATRTAYQAQTASCQQELDARTGRLEALDRDLSSLKLGVQADTERCAALQEDLAVFHARAADQAVAAGITDATVAEVREALDAHAAIHLEERARAALVADVTSRFAGMQEAGRISVLAEGGKVAIGIQTDLLFNAGTVTLSPRGEQIVADLARGLGPSAGWTLRLEGHTDAVARHSAEHPSNWELGFAQAMSVLRHLQDEGVQAAMSAGSYADGVPLADNTTDEGRARNRRLEIVLEPPPVVAP